MMQKALKVAAIVGFIGIAVSPLRAEMPDVPVMQDEPLVETEKVWRSGPGVWEMGPPDRHDFYIEPNIPDEGYAYSDPGPMYWEEADVITTFLPNEPHRTLKVLPDDWSPSFLPNLFAPSCERRCIPAHEYLKNIFTHAFNGQCLNKSAVDPKICLDEPVDPLPNTSLNE